MKCNSDLSDISLNFQNGGVLYPEKLTFNYGQGSFSTLRCSFGKPVVEDLEDNLGDFFEIQRVEVESNGKTLHSMYFEPRFLELGTSGTRDKSNGYLELHDLREHLAKGQMDFAPDRVTASDSFNAIYEARVNDDIFTGIEVLDEGDTISEWFTFHFDSKVPGTDLISSGEFNETDKTGPVYPFSVDNILNSDEIDIDSNFAVNYDSSPLKALKKAERKHAVSTHVSPEGKLIVGPYSNTNSYSASNMDSQGDIHIKNSSLGVKSNKVSRVVLRGPVSTKVNIGQGEADAWVEEKNLALTAISTNSIDYRKIVTVDNPNVDNGIVLKREVDNLEAQDQPLKNLARKLYIGTVVSHNSGTITFSMGEDPGIVPRIKDRINIELFSVDCSPASGADRLSNEYFISNIRHEVDSGWDVTANVMDVPPQDPSSLRVSVKIHDVENDQTITNKEKYGFELGK